MTPDETESPIGENHKSLQPPNRIDSDNSNSPSQQPERHGFLPGTGVSSNSEKPVDNASTIGSVNAAGSENRLGDNHQETDSEKVPPNENPPSSDNQGGGFRLPVDGGIPDPDTPKSQVDKGPHTGFSGRIPTEVIPSKSTLMKKMVAPIVFLFLLIGGFLGVYYGYIIPNEPANILQAALVNSIAGRLKSATFGGSVSITSLSSKRTINLSFNGIAGQPGKIDVNISLGSLFTSFGVEVRSLDAKTAYVRFTGVSSVEKLLTAIGIAKTDPSLIAILQALNNQWYILNPSLVADIEHGIYIQSNQTSVADSTKTLSKIYAQNHFFTIKQTLADQTIEDQDSYHYKVLIDNTKLKSFLVALNNTQAAGIHLSQAQLNSLLSSISRSNNSSYPFDIWVTKDNRLLDQVSSNVNTGATLVNVTLTLSKINQPFEVAVPPNPHSVIDLLTQITQLSKASTASGGSPLSVIKNLSSGL